MIASNNETIEEESSAKFIIGIILVHLINIIFYQTVVSKALMNPNEKKFDSNVHSVMKKISSITKNELIDFISFQKIVLKNQNAVIPENHYFSVDKTPVGKIDELDFKTLQTIEDVYLSSKTLEPVKGIQKTINSRAFYYDPTIEISNDIKDEKGNIVAKKGTKINPLKNYSIRRVIFFDATDTKQLAWAKKQTDDWYCKFLINATWIVTNGDIKALANEYNESVFFDQNGELIKKLGITQIPAIVSGSNEHIKIEEVEAL